MIDKTKLKEGMTIQSNAHSYAVGSGRLVVTKTKEWYDVEYIKGELAYDAINIYGNITNFRLK